MLRLPRAVPLLFVCATTALAQDRASPAATDSSAARIMARVGNKPGAYWLQDILRRAGAEYPQATLDEIADSLVMRAIDPAAIERQSAAYGGAVDAINALAGAGSAGPWKGRPYAGMLDRMITVHRRAQSRFVRQLAIRFVLYGPSHARAIAYLRQVAESSDETAADAVQFLIMDAHGANWVGLPIASERQQSAAAVNALVSRGRVTNRVASEMLQAWVSQNPSPHPPGDGS
jgi:hypothetical protein